MINMSMNKLVGALSKSVRDFLVDDDRVIDIKKPLSSYGIKTNTDFVEFIIIFEGDNCTSYEDDISDEFVDMVIDDHTNRSGVTISVEDLAYLMRKHEVVECLNVVEESKQDRVIRLHGEGHSQNNISRITGIPRSSVGDIVRRHKGTQKKKQVAKVEVKPEPVVSWNAGYSFINCYIDGEVITADRKHEAFEEAFKILIETNDVVRAASMLSIKKAIETYVNGDIKIVGSTLTYKDVTLDTNMTRRVIEMWKAGEDITTMINFLVRLVKNPRREAVYELFDFLKHNDIEITDDGYFLAYKRVRDDYTDIWTGTFDNSIGATPRMEPFEVDPDRKNECSAGLHVASGSYIPHYSRRKNDRVVQVKVDPANVVAIPEGYDHAKLRTWTYTVVKDVTDLFLDNTYSYY